MTDITVIVPVKNEEKNLAKCLRPLQGWANEILVVDSQSKDRTEEIAMEHGAKVIQFYYKGGWPKKRQFILDTYHFRTAWIMLLDSDEILSEANKKFISQAVEVNEYDAFFLNFKLEFLGRMLRHAHGGLRKLSLFKIGKAHYERRLEAQDESMADMEIHEHVVSKGPIGQIKSPILHRNLNNMSRYIIKHDEYSNYEARVHLNGTDEELKASFWGTKEQRRRYLKKHLITNAWSPFFYFIYRFLIKGGFRDGRPGFFYILYQCIYLYFISAKMYEIQITEKVKK